jgi:hypothetical protein
MKRAILSVIIYVALLNSVAAQFIFIPKKPVGSFSGGLIDKYESCQLKDTIPFSYVRIIDSRYDTTVIGLYLDGYIALKDTSQPLALQHTVDKYYHSLYTPGKDTLIIQLEKLNIQDDVIRDTNFILTAGYISCKEYSGTGNTYRYMGSADTMMYDKFSYATVFKLHKNGKHTNYQFWDYYLLRLCEAMITNASQFNNTIDSNQQQYTIEDIKKEGLLKRQKPILTDTILKPGFYNNFSEFENNSPGFTYDSADALPKLLELMHYRVSKNMSNEAPDTSYWGFCNGKHLFIRNGYNFFELERKDAAFYIAPTLDAKRRDVKTAGWDLLLGLATLSAGIATKSGLDFDGFSAVPEPAVPYIVSKIDNANSWGLRLDLDTGNITY